jgi:hypothetical protein
MTIQVQENKLNLTIGISVKKDSVFSDKMCATEH